MGKTLLQKGTVGHDGTGQIGEVLFAEKGKRDFPKLFGESDAPHAAFYIGGEIGGVILKPGGQKNQSDAEDTTGGIQTRFAADIAAHQVADETVKKPNGKHKRYILKYTCDTALDKILCALLGQGVFFL